MAAFHVDVGLPPLFATTNEHLHQRDSHPLTRPGRKGRTWSRTFSNLRFSATRSRSSRCCTKCSWMPRRWTTRAAWSASSPSGVMKTRITHRSSRGGARAARARPTPCGRSRAPGRSSSPAHRRKISLRVRDEHEPRARTRQPQRLDGERAVCGHSHLRYEHGEQSRWAEAEAHRLCRAPTFCSRRLRLRRVPCAPRPLRFRVGFRHPFRARLVPWLRSASRRPALRRVDRLRSLPRRSQPR